MQVCKNVKSLGIENEQSVYFYIKINSYIWDLLTEISFNREQWKSVEMFGNFFMLNLECENRGEYTVIASKSVSENTCRRANACIKPRK